MKQHPGQIDVAGEARTDDEPPLAGVQVLLVEDEFDIATLLLFILAEAGAEAVWVVQSSEALDYLHHFQPDILLSNIKLPDHDGDWLIQEIRKAESARSPRLPAIAITSYTREVAATQVLEAGFDRFMPKHFDPEEIISTILDLV